MTAPFAVHKLDRDRAKFAVNLARDSGISKDEFVAESRSYLETAQGLPTDVDEQLARVRKYVGNKLG